MTPGRMRGMHVNSTLLWEFEGSESNGLSVGNTAVLILICFIVLVILVLCVWMNYSWSSLGFSAVFRGLLLSEPIVNVRNAAHGSPETLHGFALENRVQPRRHQRRRVFYPPDNTSTVCIDDIALLPDADPPPQSEEELQRQREEAERIASPTVYGRSMYLPRLTRDISNGSFCHSLAARGCSPGSVSRGSLVFHGKGGDNLSFNTDDGDELGSRRLHGVLLQDTGDGNDGKRNA